MNDEIRYHSDHTRRVSVSARRSDRRDDIDICAYARCSYGKPFSPSLKRQSCIKGMSRKRQLTLSNNALESYKHSLRRGTRAGSPLVLQRHTNSLCDRSNIDDEDPGETIGGSAVRTKTSSEDIASESSF